jgi:hypothetical protein
MVFGNELSDCNSQEDNCENVDCHIEPQYPRVRAVDRILHGLEWLDRAIIAGTFILLESFLEGLAAYVGSVHLEEHEGNALQPEVLDAKCESERERT